MEVVRTVSRMRAARQQWDGPLGLVPTMGCLHQGHLAIVRQARTDTPAVIVSIYVNPSQFGAGEDFVSYPRQLDRDLELLKAEGVDLVFAPSDDGMYPPGFSTHIDVTGVSERLEGAARPGHFRGVATVVAKLCNLVRPSHAYFGQKDAQQLLVIRRMVADLDMGIHIIAVPTVRESDGLALSSRNTYLNARERRAATVLFRALTLARGLHEAGEDDADRIRAEMTSLIENEPLARLDYVSIADAETLGELRVIVRPALASLAVHIGKTRLIDNMPLDRQDSGRP